MSDLFGNHIVGFPKRWLIYCCIVACQVSYLRTYLLIIQCNCGINASYSSISCTKHFESILFNNENKNSDPFKSSEHIKEKGGGSYLFSAGSYLVSDPSDFATCSQNEYCNCNFNRILHTRSSIIQM